MNGWEILSLVGEGQCMMLKSSGDTTLEFVPAHGTKRTRFSILDERTTFSSGPAGMSLRVPGGAGPYNAFSADATAVSAHELTVNIYGGEEVVPWLAKATEFRINVGEYRLAFPLSGQKEALAAVYECLRDMPRRQEEARREDAELEAEMEGW